MENHTGIIILAAGASARIGRPKQALLFEDQTLLQRIAGTAHSLNSGPVIIVLGANARAAGDEWDNAIPVINDNWQEGMGSSICCGLKKLTEKSPQVQGAIFTVCDQPYITVSVLQSMLAVHHQTRLPIVACSYGNSIGTPVFFHHSIFPELLQLKGDRGAKQLVNKDKLRVGLVDFPLGNIDIDTEDDYVRLTKKEP